ncbi:MAG: nascent polypeptide-associated complex protein [Candidatus Nanosalina sp.]
MFGGKDMAKMMKQMGVDMEELDADRVEVHIGDEKLVFNAPEISKIDAQGNEIFQLQGSYSREEKSSEPEVEEEDIDLVVEKTGASREDAREALKDSEEVADAIMKLQ